MAMETVTNYKCDRCGRSELREGVEILTLTVRSRAGKNIPGQGVSQYSAHVCAENCLKIVKASMTPVGIPGRYDRKAAASKRQAATKPATKPTATSTATASTSKGATKRGTKNGSTARTSKIKATESTDTRTATIKAVRALTRTDNGGFAKGYNHAKERAMIAERERQTSES
jgi:hypothetical protein